MTDRKPQPADDLETLGEQAALDAAKARQHIESLFQLLRGSDDAEPAAAAPGESHSVSQRFRILRQHARGGLGEIWIAQDMELGREVALKEIRSRFAGRSDSWSRFQREATITGQLEHPGIVPIYALGHHENGQPFYAMRFVQGDTLADAIAQFHRRDDAASPPNERNLQLRKLITRLIDVCDAVAYAHSRNIIHRDLKPANIMLGEFGETLVVDWGLAKSLNEVTDETASTRDNITAIEPGSQSTPTQMGSAIGSPPYMSPEQAGGRLDQLGPASDIYSLGATLFELLTGQAPIGAARADESREKLSIKELLQRIQEGRFPRPTTVNPTVPRALEAVSLKAMALRPENRYASSRDLSADLESWLADEPVSAWTEPTPVRLRRWMRRHQTAVVSTLATVFVAVLGLSISLAIISERNERLADGKNKLESSNRQLTESNRELEASNTREREQTNLATKRANELNKANLQITAEVEKAQRSEKDTAAVLQFFQENVLVAGRPKGQRGGRGVDLTIREALTAAEPQIASMFQGRPMVEAIIRTNLGRTSQYLGDTASAIRQFERSRQLIVDEFGSDHEYALSALDDLASAYQAAGKHDLALLLFEQVVASQKKRFGADAPNTLKSTNDLAEIYRTTGKLEEALQLFEEVVRRSTAKLGRDHPNTLRTINNLALTYQATGKLDLALPLFEEVVKKHESQAGLDHPDTLVTTNNLACAYYAAAKFDFALPLLQRVLISQKSKLGPDHPNTLKTMSNLVDAYRSIGKLDEALTLNEEHLELTTTKLGRDDPETLMSMNNLAFAYQSIGKLNLALPLYEEALKLRSAKLGREHAHTLNSLGNFASALLEAKRANEALPLFEQFIAGQRRRFGPAGPGFAGLLASTILKKSPFGFGGSSRLPTQTILTKKPY